MRHLSEKQKQSPLYRRIREEAKKKFDVYPSRWAATWISQEYRKRSFRRTSRRTSIRNSYKRSQRSQRSKRSQSGGGRDRYRIPDSVQRAAQKALDLKKMGFAGGTATGHKRAKQLARGGTISEHDLRVMRAWFARHSYTSYPGYKDWVRHGRPLHDPHYKSKGSIYAWLAWGGDPARNWVNKLSLD